MPEPNVLGSKYCVWIHFSPLIDLGTLPESNILLGIFSRPYPGPSIFYSDPIHIILIIIQLNISQVVIIFGSVWFLYKKSNQPKKKIKKNPKPVQTGFFSFFRFGSVFLVWVGLAWFRFFVVWVRFGFFGFRLIKPKPNQTGWFFQNFNLFFSRFGFFGYFFSDFLDLIGFLVFLLTPNHKDKITL
jgi:hypothetical protein